MYFRVPEIVRLNATTIIKIPNKWELQQTAINHSSSVYFKSFKKIYKKFAPNPYSFLVNNTTLPSDNSLIGFKCNLLEKIL